MNFLWTHHKKTKGDATWQACHVCFSVSCSAVSNLSLQIPSKSKDVSNKPDAEAIQQALEKCSSDPDGAAEDEQPDPEADEIIADSKALDDEEAVQDEADAAESPSSIPSSSSSSSSDSSSSSSSPSKDAAADKPGGRGRGRGRAKAKAGRGSSKQKDPKKKKKKDKAKHKKKKKKNKEDRKDKKRKADDSNKGEEKAIADSKRRSGPESVHASAAASSAKKVCRALSPQATLAQRAMMSHSLASMRLVPPGVDTSNVTSAIPTSIQDRLKESSIQGGRGTAKQPSKPRKA